MTSHSRGSRALLHQGLGLMGAVLLGALLAAQARVNGALGARLGDGVAAAMISFGGSLLLVLIGAAVLPGTRHAFRRLATRLRSHALRPWHCLGGVCGGYLVCTQGLAAGALGVALFTIAVVAGQVLCGLAVDRWGMGPGGPRPLTLTRAVGAVLALVAVVLAVRTSLASAQASWLIVLPLLAGCGTAWQQAANGRVRQAADSALVTSVVNFITGTTVLLIVFLLEIGVRGLPRSAPSEIGLYLGGLFGIVVVGGTAVIVHYTGVLLLSMGMVGGQLLGAGVLDAVLPAPGSTVHASTVAGIALAFVAVAIASWPSRGPQANSSQRGGSRGARGSTRLPR